MGICVDASVTDVLAFAMWDRFPASKGHALIIPRRHISAFHETTSAERLVLFRLLDEVRQFVGERHSPDGFNIGINEGVAVGQTVPHLHIHLIPRYAADVANPAGGVRGVIPGKQNYLRTEASVLDHNTETIAPPHDAVRPT